MDDYREAANHASTKTLSARSRHATMAQLLESLAFKMASPKMSRRNKTTATPALLAWTSLDGVPLQNATVTTTISKVDKIANGAENGNDATWKRRREIGLATLSRGTIYEPYY